MVIIDNSPTPMQDKIFRNLTIAGYEFVGWEEDLQSGTRMMVVRRNKSSIPDYCSWDTVRIQEDGSLEIVATSDNPSRDAEIPD